VPSSASHVPLPAHARPLFAIQGLGASCDVRPHVFVALRTQVPMLAATSLASLSIMLIASRSCS